MGIVDSSFRSITCDGPGCDKTVTFNQKDSQQVTQDNPWLNSTRVIQTGDGRTFAFCSDICDVAHTATGLRNPPEKKKIIDVSGTNDAAIKLAAQAAKAAEEATKNIKSGQPTSLHVVK